MRKFPLHQVIPGRPLILGHRGSPGEFRENTIASFHRALEQGADGVELDVRRTGDGQLVVFHDDALHSGEALLSHPMEELRQAARPIGIEIHTFSEVLRALAGNGFLNIELKEMDTTRDAVDLATSILPAETFVFSSFLPAVVRECRRLAPEVPAIFIIESCHDPDEILRLLESSDASGVGVWREAFTPEHAQICSTRQIPVFVWTVNDPAEARRFADMGVAGLITDVPAVISAIWNTA